MTNYEKIKSLGIVNMAWFLCAIHDELISNASSQYDKNGNYNCGKVIAYPEMIKWLDEEYEPTDDVWSDVSEAYDD